MPWLSMVLWLAEGDWRTYRRVVNWVMIGVSSSSSLLWYCFSMGSKKIFPISLLFVHKSENSLVHVHCLCSVLWALNFYLKSNGATRQVRYAYIRPPFFTSRCAAIISMHLFLYRENATPIWVPYIGQKFRNLEDAWSFWVDYGSHAGFEVRKRYTNESKCDKRVTSCRYVCAKEGCRARDRRDHVTKNPRAETRTCCPVRMGITLDRVTGNYEVFDLILEHNHVLHLPQTFHLMTS